MITRTNEQVGISCAGINTCRHNSYGTRRTQESGMGKIEGGRKRISTFQIFAPLLAHASLLPPLPPSLLPANILTQLGLGIRKYSPRVNSEILS